MCSVKPDINRKSDSRREFLLELGKELVKPYVIQRSEGLSRYSFLTRQSMGFILGKQTKNKKTQNATPTQGRCHLCPRKKDRKIKKTCSECQNFVCKGNILV